MYADDIILLSISVTDLQLMFNLCSEVFTDLDLPINVSKCHCICIGPRCNTMCSTLNIQGAAVHWAESTKYLGITICQAKSFKCLWDESKSKFYCNCNVILGRLGTTAPANVVLKLISTQSVQNLLYGIASTSLNNSELKSFSHAYNSMFSKVFNSFDSHVISYCQFYSGHLCFNMLYDLQRYVFLSKLLANECINNNL